MGAKGASTTCHLRGSKDQNQENPPRACSRRRLGGKGKDKDLRLSANHGAVEKHGEDKFTREILYYCPSRGVASYLEAKEQFERKVLEVDDYYNGIINVRIGGSKILKESLKKMLKI